MSLEITNNQARSVVVWDPVFEDDTITFAGADTLLAGTILARQTVDTAVADGVADVGNTGDGTVTLCSVVEGPVVPLAGGYVLTCTEAVVNGGVFKLEDPNGAIVATGLTLTVGAGATTVIEAGGLQFTVTDGATDFAVGDFFTITVVANGKLVVFAVAGAGGAQVPVAILRDELVAAGAGDLPCRPIISGRVRKNDLVIDVDGDSSNVDAAVVDKLRDYSIIALGTTQLAELDNQ